MGDYEEDYLKRSLQGDREAFCALIEPFEARLFGQALAMSRDREVARDLLQETLFQAWRSLARFNGKCKFSTWLYAILHHRFLKEYTKQKRRPIALSVLAKEGTHDAEVWRDDQLHMEEKKPSDYLLKKEAHQQLRERIRQLKEVSQEVIRLRYYAEASLKEMAAVLDIPVGTVKSRLHTALEQLRKLQRNEPFFLERDT